MARRSTARCSPARVRACACVCACVRVCVRAVCTCRYGRARPVYVPVRRVSVLGVRAPARCSTYSVDRSQDGLMGSPTAPPWRTSGSTSPQAHRRRRGTYVLRSSLRRHGGRAALRTEQRAARRAALRTEHRAARRAARDALQRGAGPKPLWATPIVNVTRRCRGRRPCTARAPRVRR